MSRLDLACLLRAVAPVLLAVALGACPASAQVTPPPTSKPPAGTTFVGGTCGGACTGDSFSPAGVGRALCDEAREWAYSSDDLAAYGYTELRAGT